MSQLKKLKKLEELISKNKQSNNFDYEDMENSLYSLICLYLECSSEETFDYMIDEYSKFLATCLILKDRYKCTIKEAIDENIGVMEEFTISQENTKQTSMKSNLDIVTRYEKEQKKTQNNPIVKEINEKTEELNGLYNARPLYISNPEEIIKKIHDTEIYLNTLHERLQNEPRQSNASIIQEDGTLSPKHDKYVRALKEIKEFDSTLNTKYIKQDKRQTTQLKVQLSTNILIENSINFILQILIIKIDSLKINDLMYHCLEYFLGARAPVVPPAVIALGVAKARDDTPTTQVDKAKGRGRRRLSPSRRIRQTGGALSGAVARASQSIGELARIAQSLIGARSAARSSASARERSQVRGRRFSPLRKAGVKPRVSGTEKSVVLSGPRSRGRLECDRDYNKIVPFLDFFDKDNNKIKKMAKRHMSYIKDNNKLLKNITVDGQSMYMTVNQNIDKLKNIIKEKESLLEANEGTIGMFADAYHIGGKRRKQTKKHTRNLRKTAKKYRHKMTQDKKPVKRHRGRNTRRH